MLTIPAVESVDPVSAPTTAPTTAAADTTSAPPPEAEAAAKPAATLRKKGPIEVLMLPGKNGVPEIVRRRKREPGEV